MKTRKTIAVCGLVLFFLIVFLPLCGMPVPALNRTLDENRTMAEFPSLTKIRPRTIEDWFDDHYALRADLITAGTNLRIALGGDQINNTAIGKDGWLFYLADSALNDITRTSRYSEALIEKTVRAQKDLSEWLSDKKIGYYILVCPNKESIYPEYLPETLQGFEGPKKIDAWYSAVSQIPGIQVVFPKEELLAEKDKHDVYLKSDTHWNAFGSFVGYSCLMDRIAVDYPQVHALADNQIQLDTIDEWDKGDLARFICRTGLHNEDRTSYSAINATAEETDDNELAETVWVNPNKADMPSVVLFRDSFSTLLIPLFAETFSKVTVVRNNRILKDVIEMEQPDIVICEYVERYISRSSDVQ